MIASQVHVFALPDRATTLGLDDRRLTWATCTDFVLAVLAATIVFHAQPIPLDAKWTATKCMACGRRDGLEMAS